MSKHLHMFPLYLVVHATTFLFSQALAEDIKRRDSFFTFLISPLTLQRALKISLVVGSIVLTIHQSQAILAGNYPELWKVILTYLTPFSVSAYSTAKMLSDQNRNTGAAD